MRKIVVSEYLSLDGVMEEPSWTAPYWNDEIAKFKSVVLGKGKAFFKAGSQASLKLVETRSFSSGVALLRYHIVQAHG